MKEWQTPELEIEIFYMEDVMTESFPDVGEEGTPWV